MIKGKLTADNPESQEFTYSGVASFMVWGSGELQIMRSVGGSPFLPLTDAYGDTIVYDPNGNVFLNCDMENTSRSANFKLSLISGEADYIVTWGW